MSRILNRQRQLAEAGRLRLGYTTATSNGKSRPVRSETWIFTSHDREKAAAAAEIWGGELEQWQPLGNGAQQWRVITKATSLDAILPPGDPLNQAYETWSRGGAQRRCDGVTEQFTGSPCLCAAQFGEQWYEQPKGRVCDTKSRLKVLIPDLPGLGSYRLETGSYYAADEIAGMVDFIRSAVGDQTLVPVRLRIEPRTRVANGETKQFVVPVVELRGVTTGELLAGTGQMRQIAGPGQARSIEPPRPDYLTELEAARSTDDCSALWRQAGSAGHLTDELKAAITAKAQSFQTPGSASEEPPSTAAGADPGPDADAVWMQVCAAAGERGMDDATLRAELESVCGVTAEEASAEQLGQFLAALTTGEAVRA